MDVSCFKLRIKNLVLAKKIFDKKIITNLIKFCFNFNFLNRTKGTRKRDRECFREAAGQFETYGETCDSEEAKGRVFKYTSCLYISYFYRDQDN